MNQKGNNAINSQWMQFARTGRVADYLRYCATQDGTHSGSLPIEEVTSLADHHRCTDSAGGQAFGGS